MYLNISIYHPIYLFICIYHYISLTIFIYLSITWFYLHIYLYSCVPNVNFINSLYLYSTNKTIQFQDFVYLTQVVQTICITAEAEHYRRILSESGYTRGTLYWQLVRMNVYVCTICMYVIYMYVLYVCM